MKERSRYDNITERDYKNMSEEERRAYDRYVDNPIPELELLSQG